MDALFANPPPNRAPPRLPNRPLPSACVHAVKRARLRAARREFVSSCQNADPAGAATAPSRPLFEAGALPALSAASGVAPAPPGCRAHTHAPTLQTPLHERSMPGAHPIYAAPSPL